VTIEAIDPAIVTDGDTQLRFLLPNHYPPATLLPLLVLFYSLLGFTEVLLHLLEVWLHTVDIDKLFYLIKREYIY
jgi:hypothetical protein